MKQDIWSLTKAVCQRGIVLCFSWANGYVTWKPNVIGLGMHWGSIAQVTEAMRNLLIVRK